MAIITRPPATVAKKAVTVRMPEPVAETLHQYASFIGSSLDHVIVEALKLIFKKDAEFKAWQDQHRTQLTQAETERALSNRRGPYLHRCLPSASATAIAPQGEKTERHDPRDAGAIGWMACPVRT